MNINKIIETTIKEFLKEYNENDSFLSNFDIAIKYAYDNIDEVAEAFDEYKKNPDNVYASYAREKYIDLIDQYVDKYNELKNETSVTIYRLIKLNSLKDLDINNIGKHWSFEKNGVGAYGEQRFAYMRSGTCRMVNFSTNVSVPFLIYAVSSSTDLNHKCSIEEPNLFLFFFVRRENKKK